MRNYTVDGLNVVKMTKSVLKITPAEEIGLANGELLTPREIYYFALNDLIPLLSKVMGTRLRDTRCAFLGTVINEEVPLDGYNITPSELRVVVNLVNFMRKLERRISRQTKPRKRPLVYPFSYIHMDTGTGVHWVHVSY